MNVANTWWIGIHLKLLASIAAATSMVQVERGLLQAYQWDLDLDEKDESKPFWARSCDVFICWEMPSSEIHI